MAKEIETYFAQIATTAEDAIRKEAPQPRIPPVFDVPQAANATAWTALAVHPMSVLETEYVGIVQAAEKAAGHDQDLARDNGFEAMSGFFALASNAPSLLGQDAPELVDERMKDLRARFEFAETLYAEGKPEALQELTDVIGDAAEMIAAITDAQGLANAADGVKAAAGYLGLFAAPPDQAASRWTQSHADPAQLGAYFTEVESQLVRPLTQPANAVASSRSLYNIEPFFLYRLMHRFVGGDQVTAMDLKSKGIASGAATKAMHNPGWAWLTGWHEGRVLELATSLKQLDARLKRQFDLQDDLIRFHLKGGRAMYTALGSPAQGSNDWDTGILINPALSARQWYTAFAEVNDLVVAFLDRARFSYTALLNEHRAELSVPPLAAMAVAEPFDLDEKPYSKLALLADHQTETISARAGRGGSAMLAVGARQRLRSAGVNGELIDIGISKRASVELAEHWAGTTIVERKGVRLAGIPVPTLPYFVDDFSTIVREALRQGTADRKLAKRLIRLNLVLGSDDPTLKAAMEGAASAAAEALPKGAAAFGVGTGSSVERLTSWSLAAMLQSIPDATFWPGWLGSFDRYLAQQAKELLDQKAVADLWRMLKDDIKAEDQDACLGLLCVLNAATTLSGELLADAVTLSRAIGGDDLPDALYHKMIEVVIQNIMALSKPRSPDGLFYLTGGLAARMQAQHETVDTAGLLAACPDGVVEITYRLGNVDPGQALGKLAERLNTVLKMTPLKATIEKNAVVVTLSSPIAGLTIKVDTPAMVLVRTELPDEAARILDYVNGVPIASTRDLIRLFRQRAAQSHDFDLRQSRQAVANVLLDQVLGRQLS